MKRQKFASSHDLGCVRGFSLLHAAAGRNILHELKSFLEKASFQQIEAKDELGRTPLRMAICNRHLEAAKILLNCGADLENARDDKLAAFHRRLENTQDNTRSSFFRTEDAEERFIAQLETYIKEHSLEQGKSAAFQRRKSECLCQ